VSAGAHTLFWTLMPMIVSPFSARLGRRISPTTVMAGGLVLVAGGLAELALSIGAATSALSLAPGLIATGVGIGMVIPNLAAAALDAVPAPDMGKASGVLSTSRQLGAVFGVSVGVAIFEASSRGGDVSAGVRAVLTTATVVALAGAVAASAPRALAWRRGLVLAEG